MPAGQPQSAERRGVGAQLVGYQQLLCEALFSHELAHQPQRRSAVAAALDQHVEDLALMIDRTPEIHLLAGDPYHKAMASRTGPSEGAPEGANRKLISDLLNNLSYSTV